ncbi:16S rRNA (cytidine(1402)-2'-O)-methyltransferase [Arhodomonas sp. AD133]|uniref:16S rRNA (cytidine(1402)-2'-O)-methyltransferase n=1 Tax=Arhodomonas sp. AD133 TaxID=3415009 RepID=UPI003EBB3989
MSNSRGTLYVVATPIGHLDDLSRRAAETLAQVAWVAAEDTRHSGRLLAHLGVRTPMISLHEHNEAERVARVAAVLDAGEDVALISDAGTPLISDPGYVLVRSLRERGVTVSPVPGPSSIVAALSVAGLPTDRFVYEGFLPAKAAQRRRRLEALAGEPRTLVVLESSHRIEAALRDMVTVWGAQREVCLARELTKRFETVRLASVGELAEWLAGDPDQRRGEFVLIVHGAPAKPPEPVVDADALLAALAAEMPPRRAAKLVARLTGVGANELYDRITRD